MRSRPRSSFILKLKALRCGRCGRKLNTQQKRCRGCHTVARRPTK